MKETLAHEPLSRILAKPEKEITARDWFFIGSELSRMGRSFKSTKLFGQYIALTELGKLPPSDRSDARWIYENWHVVLKWIEAQVAGGESEPFAALAKISLSHPSSIRHGVRKSLRAGA